MQKEFETQNWWCLFAPQTIFIPHHNQQQVNPQNWCVVVNLETGLTFNTWLEIMGF